MVPTRLEYSLRESGDEAEDKRHSLSPVDCYYTTEAFPIHITKILQERFDSLKHATDL